MDNKTDLINITEEFCLDVFGDDLVLSFRVISFSMHPTNMIYLN